MAFLFELASVFVLVLVLVLAVLLASGFVLVLVLVVMVLGITNRFLGFFVAVFFPLDLGHFRLAPGVVEGSLQVKHVLASEHVAQF
jgi:uncharacterized membrane protein required for colicin V production